MWYTPRITLSTCQSINEMDYGSVPRTRQLINESYLQSDKNIHGICVCVCVCVYVRASIRNKWNTPARQIRGRE